MNKLNELSMLEKLSKSQKGRELLSKIPNKVMGVSQKMFVNDYLHTFLENYKDLTLEKIKQETKNPDNFVFKTKDKFLNKSKEIDLDVFTDYLEYATSDVLKNIKSKHKPHTLDAFGDIMLYFDSEDDLLDLLKSKPNTDILTHLIFDNNKNKLKTKNKNLMKFFEHFNEDFIPDLSKKYKYTFDEFKNLVQQYDRVHLKEIKDDEKLLQIYPADINTQTPNLEKIKTFLKYFNLNKFDHQVVLSKRFIGAENFIFYDVEVTPFVWSITFAKINSGKTEWTYFYGANTLSYEYLKIKDNPYKRLNEYVKSNLDYVFTGWYSNSYDTYILRTLLSGQNPWLMNEFLINFNDYFKNTIKERYPKSFEKLTDKGLITMISNKDIKDLSPKNFGWGYYISETKSIRYEEIKTLFVEWLIKNYGENSKKYPYFSKEFLDFKTNEPNTHIQEKYNDIINENTTTSEKVRNYLTSQLVNMFSQYLSGGKSSLWFGDYKLLEYDLLESKVFKGNNNNETKSLKSLGAYLGTSIEEKAVYFDQFRPLSKFEVADLLDYNSKDVGLTVLFGHKIKKHIKFEMEKLLISYEFLFDSIEKQKMLSRSNSKTNKLVILTKDRKRIITPDDIIPPWNSYGLTDAQLVGKFLTLNGKKPKYNDIMNDVWEYKTPKAVELLKQQMQPNQQIEYQRAIDMFTSLNGMKMKDMMSEFKLFPEYELQNVHNSGYKIKFGGGGAHAAYVNYFLKRLFWMSDYTAFYPNLMLVYNFFPIKADRDSYEEIKIRRETLKREFSLFWLEPTFENLNKIKSHIKEFRKINFLDNNVFKSMRSIKTEEDLLLWLKVNKKSIRLFSYEIGFYVEFLKLILNTVYGATNDKNNLMYNPKSTFGSTFTGQLLVLGHLLMIDPYVKAIQTNTDANYYVPYDEAKILEMNQKFIEITKINIETEEANGIIQRDVNNYITLVEKEIKDESDKVIGKKLTPKKGTGFFGRFPSKFMTLDNGILVDNKIPIIEEGIVNSFLGVTPEETIQKAIDNKEWWKFALIGKKGNGYDVLVESFENMSGEIQFNVRPGNTFRAFATYNGVNVMKYKIGKYDQNQKYNEYQFIKDGVFYEKYMKVTDIPNGVQIFDGDLSKIDHIDINARHYINKIKDTTSKFKLEDTTKFGKITKNILNIMKKINDKLMNEFEN